MKKLKKAGQVLLAIIVVLAIGLGIFAYTLKPEYNGEKQLAKLSEEVTVHYDQYGIPHIYGKNEKDAFRALGYVHAQDRLWQMELLRRIGTGGLSEVFGADLVGTDKFFLSLGIDDATTKTVADLDLNAVEIQLSQAYIDGINQFIEEGPTPIEFYLTGIEKEPFTLNDVYNTMGYMAFSFAMAHKTDPLLTNIKDKLGIEYLKDLQVDIGSSTTWIKNYKTKTSDSIQNSITAMLIDALGEIPIPLFEGSNGWVLSPEKTKNGKVIFANDPHIGFAQPSVWYEAHVSTPTYEKYGYHIAGVPFPLLGHDRKMAYGMTMFENDDVDFYYETEHATDNTKYKTNDGWSAYEVISKSIKVKDQEDDVAFNYKRTTQGPILNGIANQITGERPISMSWIYTQEENKMMKVLYGIGHADNILGFQTALADLHAPGLNIMYGDAEGNVAWWATAKLYRIPDSVRTKFIIGEGASSWKPTEYLDFSENPQAINPPWHYVYSANNQPDSIAGMQYPGYYLPENRAKRIVHLLEPKNDWDKEAVSKMIIDITSSVNPSVVTDFMKSLNVKELTENQLKILDVLNEWQGDYPIDSIEATIYHRWVYFFLKNTFADELGKEMFGQFLSTHLHKRLIATMAADQTSVWWDNINTIDKVETNKEIVQTALLEALSSLEKDFGPDWSTWTWDKIHTLEHEHPIGRIAALRSFFNVGPFPVHGTKEVINNMAFGYTESGIYKVGSGPSTRRVIDFSDIENSISILPTGQSGNPFSKHYKDQAEMFVNGEFRKMMMNKDEIIEKAESTLVLKP